MSFFETIGLKKQAPKTPEAPSHLGRDLKQFGIVAVVAAMSFLESCKGVSHERATTADIKNHIENPDFEKVDSTYMESLQNALDDSYDKGYVRGSESDSIEDDMREMDSYNVTENDSNIVVDLKVIVTNGAETAASDMNYHIEVDKKTGVATLYSKQDFSTYPSFDGKPFGIMLINKDGQVVKEDGYGQGDAKMQVEGLAMRIAKKG